MQEGSRKAGGQGKEATHAHGKQVTTYHYTDTMQEAHTARHTAQHTAKP